MCIYRNGREGGREREREREIDRYIYRERGRERERGRKRRLKRRQRVEKVRIFTGNAQTIDLDSVLLLYCLKTSFITKNQSAKDLIGQIVLQNNAVLNSVQKSYIHI